MKWREIATYLLLYRVFNRREIDYFTALSFLKLFYSTRSAKRELKRLVNLGLIRKIDMKLEIIDIEDFIKLKVFPYILKRFHRRLKNRDKKSEIILEEDRVRIICHNSDCIRYIEEHKEEISYLPLKVEVEVH